MDNELIQKLIGFALSAFLAWLMYGALFYNEGNDKKD